MFLIIGGMLSASAFCNWFLFNHGVHSMFLRYPLNVIIGYIVFFLLIRLWLAYVHHLCGIDRHRLDFSLPEKAKMDETSGSSWANYLDIGDIGGIDDLGCFFFLTLIVSVIASIGGFGYFLSEAPAFLSDVAASFFLAGALTKPIHKIDRPDWTGSILRWTWRPFVLAQALAFALAGTAYLISPKAHTLIEVLRK